MNASQWERAREIFDSALDLPSDSRPEFLLQACHGDSVLRTEVDELLRASAAADSSSFLDSKWLDDALPAEPDFALQPGDVVCERFQIIRHLGDGGMGRVYEAYDAVEDAGVALKSLRPEIADNPEVLKRFRQEVRIAHRITHPNICRTHHLGHDLRFAGPSDQQPFKLWFLTMEYLEGETLQQIIRRDGPIPLPQALTIARQLADALEAAHRIGAIHRDIKPGNVMICPTPSGDPVDDRAVITDFGLAKLGPGAANPDLSSISHAGRPMGTLAYMAPEQIEGSQALPATDIYAFGLVLFEMVTGVKAFPDSSTLEAASHRITAPIPSPKRLVPSLPAEWDAAIVGCLQIDPAARFQQACDVVDILEGNAASPPRTQTSRRYHAAKLPTPPRSRAKIFAIAAALAILLSLSWFAYRFFTTRTDATVAPGTLVYLAPVKNETGEKQLDNVTELVRAGLEQSAHINLLDAGRVGDILQQMTKPPDTPITQPIAREIAMRAAARRVIFASIKKSSTSYRLDIDIQQPDVTPLSFRRHTTNHWDWQAPSSISDQTISSDLLANVRDASSWVRRSIGESQNDVAQLDAPPQDVTTTSWAALSEYNHAQQLSQRGDNTGAVLALRNAVSLDPDFALAYARMGDILTAIHQTDDGIAAYLKALEKGADRRLSRRERDRIKAMYAIDTGDFQGADLALRDSISFYENDPLSWAYRVHPLKMLGRPEEAITSLNKVLQLNPKSQFALEELANTWMYMGDYDEAARAIARVQATGNQDLTNELQGHLQFLRGKIPDAEASFRALSQAKDPERRIKSLPLLARIKAEVGAYPEALSILNEATANHEINSRPGVQARVLLDRASIRHKLADYTGMLADITRALSLGPSQPNRLTASSLLGQCFATAPQKFRPEIRQALSALLHSLPRNAVGVDSELAQLRIEGELMLADGNSAGAIDAFRKAAVIDAPAGSREYLGRVLASTAAHQTDTSTAHTLAAEASRAYAAVALRPGFVWHHPMDCPPGFYADELQAFTRIATKTGSLEPDLAPALAELHLLRGDSIPLPASLNSRSRQLSRDTNKDR